jgi:RHH-type transcriptional regulator, rel operon repressor / antitoxin RelB
MSSEVVTVRLTPAIKAKLDALAQSTRRSKSWLAIALYVEQESWQIQAIEAAIALADSSQAEWIDGEAVDTWLDSWGTENERPVPRS